ncbi:MAG: hypothetical protein PHQ75_06460 [Thermoguttaceae bacterium]|nr:hypothetical protein [Thermoguttaceae bacterium]
MISKTVSGWGFILISCALLAFISGCGGPKSDKPASQGNTPKTQTPVLPTKNSSTHQPASNPPKTEVPHNSALQTTPIQGASANTPVEKSSPVKPNAQANTTLPVNQASEPKNAPESPAPVAAAVPAPAAVPSLPPAVAAEFEKELAHLSAICVSINELAMDMDIVRDEVSDSLRKFRKLCTEHHVSPVLVYDPCFETTQAKFLVRKQGPWQWSFGVKHGDQATRDYILLNMSGNSPVFSVTKEGQLAFPETAMLPLGTLSWSVEDADHNQACKSVSAQFIKPGRVTASVAFPSGDCPQFLDKMFDINLIASTGQLQFLSGNEFYFQPVGKAPVRIPLFEYYQKKREEKEKKRGSAFGTTARPSPIKDAIGMIVYTEIVNHDLAKSGITERNDTGFDFYIENADKVKLLLYTARP